MGKHLVTGGAGFIGSHIVDALVAGGHTVRVFDNFSTGKYSNLEHHRRRRLVEIMEGDLRDADALRRAVQDIEVVYHQAALASVSRSVKDPFGGHDVNVNGTMNLLMAARDAKVRRLVFAGSSSAYGDNPVSPKVETMAARPISPYAAGKLACEAYCRAFASVYGMDTVVLRYFNVFGPRQDPESQYAAAIPLFVTSLLRGEPPTIYGDGTQSRDFTFIANVVQANLLAGSIEKPLNGEVINVACGESVTVNEIIDRLNELLGTDVAPQHVPTRAGDIKHSLADIGRARTLLGYEPEVDFLDGLRRTATWYQARADSVMDTLPLDAMPLAGLSTAFAAGR